MTRFSTFTLAGLLALLPLAEASAMLITGPDARTTFEGFRDDLTIGDRFIDFELTDAGTPIPARTNLGPGIGPFAGVSFASVISTAGAPFGPFHVEVSPVFAGSDGNTIVGSPCGGCSDDGRVGYEIVFTAPQHHAGLERIWNTDTQTSFFAMDGSMLGSHRNTVNREFVGFIADGADMSGWVNRILVDTANPSVRQVGHSDDLFFGTTVVPEPAAAWLLVLGLAGLAGLRRYTLS